MVYFDSILQKQSYYFDDNLLNFSNKYLNLFCLVIVKYYCRKGIQKGTQKGTQKRVDRVYNGSGN